MRTVRKFFTGLFNINKGIKTLKEKYIPSKKEIPKTKKEKKIIETKGKVIRLKASRNSKKTYATTKSFNNKNNKFEIPHEVVKNPDAKTYLQLKNLGKIKTNKEGKPISYEKWMDIKLTLKLEKETSRAKFMNWLTQTLFKKAI